jgi:hypothetical protein
MDGGELTMSEVCLRRLANLSGRSMLLAVGLPIVLAGCASTNVSIPPTMADDRDAQV